MERKWEVSSVGDNPIFYNEKTRILRDKSGNTIARLWENADRSLSIILDTDTDFIFESGKVFKGLVSFDKPYSSTLKIKEGGILEYQKNRHNSKKEKGEVLKISVTVGTKIILPSFAPPDNRNLLRRIIGQISYFLSKFS